MCPKRLDLRIGLTPKGQLPGPNQREDVTLLQPFTRPSLCLHNGPEIVKKCDHKCHSVIGQTVHAGRNQIPALQSLNFMCFI